MKQIKLAFIAGLILTLSACAATNKKPIPSPSPSPSPSAEVIATAPPSAAPAPTAAGSGSNGGGKKTTGSLEGAFEGVTPTSVQFIINGEMQEYPAVSKISKDVASLGIKKGDKVIVVINNDIAQSIEKIVVD